MAGRMAPFSTEKIPVLKVGNGFIQALLGGGQTMLPERKPLPFPRGLGKSFKQSVTFNSLGEKEGKER